MSHTGRFFVWMLDSIEKAGTPRLNLWKWFDEIADAMVCYLCLPAVPFLIFYDLYCFFERRSVAAAEEAARERAREPLLSREERARRAKAIFDEDLLLAEFHDDELVRQATAAKAKKKYRDAMARLMNET